MDYLDKVFLDNTLRSYLVVVATILAALVLKRPISKIVASVIFVFVKKVSGNIEKSRFVALVIRPLETFIFLLIAIFAIDKLLFPERFKFDIYNVSSVRVLESITIAVVIFWFIKLLLSFINYVALVMEQKANLTISTSDNQLVFFFKDFLKVIILILGGVLLLKFSFGARIGELITGLSIVGAALALAARESLENLIASFIIFFDKPFTTGDLVRVQNFTGFVERIGLRSTRLRTFDKNLVTVPNKQMVDSILDNWSLRTNQRMELRFEISAKTTSSKISEAVEAIRNNMEKRSSLLTSYTVFVTEVSKNGVVIIVEYFTAPDLHILEFNKLRQDIFLETKRMFEEEEIEVMGAPGSVTVVNEK